VRILNLYAGIGGNRKFWNEVIPGAKVTAVELDKKIAKVYQEFNPNDEIIITDAHEYLLNNYENFDFIWSSPPCQSHSKMMKATRHKINKYPEMSLYQEIIFLQNFFKGKWIVENVKPYYKPLIEPTKQIGRHLFWSNFNLDQIEEIKSLSDFINKGNNQGVQELKSWLGLEYEGNLYYGKNHCPGQVLRNCVHPLVGKQILQKAIL
jgi:DNA (cytosine-5)-methyltransferase 1